MYTLAILAFIFLIHTLGFVFLYQSHDSFLHIYIYLPYLSLIHPPYSVPDVGFDDDSVNLGIHSSLVRCYSASWRHYIHLLHSKYSFDRFCMEFNFLNDILLDTIGMDGCSLRTKDTLVIFIISNE